MLPATVPRFVADRQALDDLLGRAKHLACPRCRRFGTLVGHGFLRGYAERGTEREVRGRRLLCSARLHRSGCGRTFSVLISSVIANFTARTSTVFGLLVQVVSGLSRKAAWARLQELGNGKRGLSLRSCYRLWVRLLAAQTRIRTALFALVPPPVTSDARPFAQLLAHLRVAFAEAECCLMQFQRTLQCGVFY